MDSLQLIILQESMQQTGLLTKMPVQTKHIETIKGIYEEGKSP
jgi:hypothetical protein